MSFTLQIMGGPSFGHSFSKPRSADTPSRLGPRHCGQSWAEANAVTRATQQTPSALNPCLSVFIHGFRLNGLGLKAALTFFQARTTHHKGPEREFLLAANDFLRCSNNSSAFRPASPGTSS